VLHSLYDTKDVFIERIAPLGVAAIIWQLSLSPQDAPLSHSPLQVIVSPSPFSSAGGLRIVVDRQAAILSGKVTSRALVTMADILPCKLKASGRSRMKPRLRRKKPLIPSDSDQSNFYSRPTRPCDQAFR